MNDIYEHKARKYEYKFLKLKKQYIGEGGKINNKLCKSIILTSKFLNLDVQEIYKSSIFGSKKWKDYINELHTGKLIWGNPYKFTDNFKIIKQISNYKKYIAKLVYIGKVINKNDLVDGKGRYNTKNCDVYGLCEFIKYLYKQFKPRIPISVELINLDNFNSIRGFEKNIRIFKK
jgi:hypothetical protein